MKFLNGIALVLILGSLADLACGQSAEFNKTVVEYYEKWSKAFSYIKQCDRFEVLGYCPAEQPTVCVMGHPKLRTRKMCDYCSVSKRYAYKFGSCPDHKLAALAKAEGFKYQKHTGTPHELKRQLSFLNQRRRKGSAQGINIDFPTGPEQENPEPIELGIYQYNPPKKSKGRSSTDMVELDFLEPIADKKKKVKAKLAQKATIDKLKKLLTKIGQLV